MKKISTLSLVLSFAFILTGCRNDQAQLRRLHINHNADDVDGFSIVTNLEETKQIHTDRQKEYLSYEGEYLSIPESSYPDGQKHLSDPLPVNLEWNFSVPNGKSVSTYDVIVGKEADLSDGYVIKGTDATKLDIYNSYLGDNYFKIVAHYSDGTEDTSKIQKYIVEDVYPRNLKIDGMTNCRDMGGGRELVDGGYIKQGLLFRTSATNSWGNGRAVVPDNITSAGKEELLKRLGCKTEINVNNSGSNQVGIEKYVEAYMWYDSGKHHLYRNAEPIKEVFHALANPDNYPVFYHCRIGTDRTGLCAILISGLLGVPENLIYQDYLFSNFGNIQEKRYIGERAGRDNILNYIEDLKAFPGEKFHNKVYNYLLSIGIPASELNSVIDILTDGEKASGNDNYQEMFLADEFNAGGIEMKTAPTSGNWKQVHANPQKYYTLEEDSKVEVIFDAKYTGKAKLVAYLGAENARSSDNSKKINDSISALLDGEDVEIDENITFATAGFGSGDSRNYYSAVVLGDIDVYKGETIVEIYGKSNNLNIGAISIIPTEKVKEDEKEEPVDPAPTPAKKGCGSSIVMVTSLSFLTSLVGTAYLLIKRRKEN